MGLSPHRLQIVRECSKDEVAYRRLVELLRAQSPPDALTHIAAGSTGDEQVKETGCLCSILQLVERPDVSLEEALRGTAALIPSGWQYPAIARARIVWGEQEFSTDGFRETEWMQTSDIIAHGEQIGTLAVCYLEERPEDAEGPFIEGERSLLDAVAERLGRVIEYKRAETALQESEERFRLAFENTNTGMCLLDLNGRFLRVNSRMCEMLGYERTELEAMSVGDLGHLDDLESRPGFYQRALAGEAQAGRFEVRYRHKQGHRVWGQVSTSLVRDSQHNPLYFISHVQDITERKQMEKALRESEQSLRALLDASQNTAILLDAGGAILATNEATVKGWGKPPDEIIGTNIYDYFSPEVAQRRKTYMDGVVASGQPVRFDDERQDRYYTNTIYPVFDDQGLVTRIAVFAADITERKRAEEAERDQRVLAEALLNISFALNSTLELNEVLRHILTNVGEVVPHDFANIMLIEAGTACMVGHTGDISSELAASIPSMQFSVADSYYLRYMAESRQPVIVSDVQDDEHWTMVSPIDSTYRAYLGSPIILAEQVIGFINLRSLEAAFFTPTHGQRLVAFANQAALAIRNAQTHEQAKELAAVEERQRLARDLHDAVSQTLFSASVIAETLPRTIPKHPDKAMQYARELGQLTRGALAEMRSLLVELRPEALLNSNLDDLIRQLCDAFTGRTRVEIDLTLTGQRTLPPDARIVFYRIAQEGLNNILKHSGATRVQVSLYKGVDRVELHIADNGRGFGIANLQAGHYGLNIMQERAWSIAADLRVESRFGKGTTITLIWLDTARAEPDHE